MKAFIKYDDRDIVYLDRDAFHRQLRNAHAEQNLPDEYRIYIEMLEDMYMMTSTANLLLEALKKEMEKKEIQFEQKQLCEDAVKESERQLERWEQMLLHSK